MEDILTTASRNQQRAWRIIEETKIFEIWKSVGARVNLVGSLRTGLLMNSLDIDFHIYSDQFTLADSFAAMAGLAENNRIKRIEFANQLDTEEKCVEWHAWYQDQGEDLWKIDMIHILEESVYAGYFEKVADQILDMLTPETKLAILSIKNHMPSDGNVPSVLIYQAVLRDGVGDITQFLRWKEDHPRDGIVEWMPKGEAS